MKKSIFCSLIGLILVMCTTLILSSCDYQLVKKKSQADVDSTFVVSQIESTINPSFYSVEDLLMFRQQEIEAYQYDNLFMSLDEEIIKNVATVCLNKYKRINKQLIIDEYLKSQSVYDNLQPQSTKDISSTTEVEDRRVNLSDSTAQLVLKATEFDTVINGKKVRMTKYQTANEQ